MRMVIGAFWMMILLGFQACQWPESEEGRLAFGVREDVILKLKQELNPDGSRLSMVFESISPYDCEGAGFEYKVSRADTQVDIALLQPDIPDPCVGGSAPAMEVIPMPSSSGIYSITIRLGDLIENTGTLTIDYKGFRLQMDTRDGLEIPNLAMHRIPQRLIWGYVYHPQQPAYALQKFNDQIAPFTSVPSLEAGHYGPFTAITPDQISLSLPVEKSSAKPFALLYLGDTNLIQQSLEEVKSSMPAGTELIIYDWRGFAY